MMDLIRCWELVLNDDDWSCAVIFFIFCIKVFYMMTHTDYSLVNGYIYSLESVIRLCILFTNSGEKSLSVKLWSLFPWSITQVMISSYEFPVIIILQPNPASLHFKLSTDFFSAHFYKRM